MNESDSVNNKCKASEKDKAWYYRHTGLVEGQVNILSEPPAKRSAPPDSAVSTSQSQENSAKLVANDPMLGKLLKVKASDQQSSSVISKHHFHDALLAETEAEVEGEVEKKQEQEVIEILSDDDEPDDSSDIKILANKV